VTKPREKDKLDFTGHRARWLISQGFQRENYFKREVAYAERKQKGKMEEAQTDYLNQR